MSIYEIDINKYTSTTKLADDIFACRNKYTGLAIKCNWLIFAGKIKDALLLEVILFAELGAPNEYNGCSWDYCTMTDLKRYITSIEPFEKKKGMGFINEIKITPENVDTIRKFNKPYCVHIQKTDDYQTYGNYTEYIYLTHYMIKGRKDFGKEQ